MRRTMIFFRILLICSNLFAQVDVSTELYKIIKTKDSLLFNVGFNNCDIIQFENLVSDNFEFYHDKSGITSSKSEFISSIKDGICKLTYKPRRELIEGSLEVYPLENNGVLYGAIQIGRHRFYAIEKDKTEHLTSIAKYSHVWLIENGNWKLSRGLSFDHQEKEDNLNINKKLLFKDKNETEKWLIKNRIPALGIGYIKDGILQEVKVYGILEKGKPAPQNTIWNVASLTKPITAMIALKLVNAGQWDLDEPIYKYWLDPDIADDPRIKQLTTRHILSHQTGFPNWRSKNASGKLSFEFEPGTKYQYSGEGFEYLRRAIENKFHKPLNLLADSLIFLPLQMTDTKYYWDKTVDETRFAKWHDGNGNLYETYKNTQENGADDLLTTIEDYSKFILYIMNGASLSKDLYSQMFSNQVRIKNNKYWGLSWWVDENIGNGENAIINGGDDKGVHTIVFMLPASKQGLIIFTNCDNGTDIYIETVLAYLGALGQGIINIETN
ncbi:MAG: class A beta-lactamase-related serine hydrolase [Flavobacteriales bacterium]|nr:class A beta-lactamase-related serine hydrolase [Flavobacteriales bacterium]